jgi:pimeloyl-ACP methyl ester carboxylesterase
MSVSAQLGAAHRVELDQGPIHYRELGTGEVIVFVHGVFTNADLWRKVVPHLVGRYRCITPDWPLGSHAEPMHPHADLSTTGLGRLVADFLAALDLHEVTLVGNDTGGALCQIVMADHRQRLGRVVLASCDAFEVYPPAPFGFLKILPRVPGLAMIVAQTQRVRALRRMPLAYGRVLHHMPEPAVSDSYTRPALRREIRRDTNKVLRGISNTHTLAAARRFADFDKPVLLAWAADDLLFPVTLADRLAGVLPHARRATISGSRTLVGEDNPEDFARVVADLIASSPPQRAAT